MLISSGIGWGQLQFALEANEVSFPPTTVDSTSTISLIVINELALPQEVSLSGLNLPFVPENLIMSIPSNDTMSLHIDFIPDGIGQYSDTLIISGSVFGTDSLYFTGEGALPIVGLPIDSLDFGVVSISNVHERFIPIINSGNGSLFIGTPSSSDPGFFSYGGLSVAEADTAFLPVFFSADLANSYSATLTIPTTDPYNSSVEVNLTALAISELSGEMCGNLSVNNSPYQLIGNVVIPADCELTVEPGVVIQGDEYRIEVMGELHANGTAADPIFVVVESIISHVDASKCTFTHCQVTENQDAYTESELDEYMIQILAEAHQMDEVSYLQEINAQEDQVEFYTLPFLYNFGVDVDGNDDGTLIGEGYNESGDDNSWQGWSGGSNGDDYYFSTNNSGSRNFFSPILQLNPEIGERIEGFSFDFKVDFYSACDYEVRFYISVDGGDWQEYYYNTCEFGWTNFDYDWDDIAQSLNIEAEPQTIQFRFYTHYYNRLWDMRIDNFLMDTSSPYDGLEISSETSNSLLDYFGSQPPYTTQWDFLQQGINTGGIHLEHTNWAGSHLSWGDEVDVVLDHSSLMGFDVDAEPNHGIWIQGDHSTLEIDESSILGHPLDGIHIRGDNTALNGYGWHMAANGDQGFHSTGTCQLDLDSIDVEFNGGDAFEILGTAEVDVYQSRIEDNGGDAFELDGANSDLIMQYSFLRNNSGDGIEMASNSILDLQNTLIGYNGGDAIATGGAAMVNYSNIIGNGLRAIHASNFSTLDNSIIWFNGAIPQLTTDNAYAASYCNVQGLNALLTSTQFAWGDECIGTNPALEDSLGHLDPYSPCVDGGMPWEQDAHIPMGLGSSRADMGMYGGPANAYWGGQAPPDGSVVITDVFDIPNDQGGQLGIQFSASPFDFGGLGFNVTYYSIWRDLAVASDTLIDVDEGNWEQIGTVPAQGFNQYGYTAETLVNSYPDDPGCVTNFIVLAHTTDNNIYWVSEVAGACAVDNLAPADPELNGLILDDADALAIQLSWPAPEEEDYAYTEIASDAGFTAQLNNDTLVVDETVIYGESYTYTVQHVDINGNASNPVALTLEASAGADLIPLVPGWNLISSDRAPQPDGIESIVSSLEPGNLEFITAFNDGVEFYNPNGLSFLNTLSSWDGGYGYWVKVYDTDTLEISGSPLPADYLPALNAGWNLIGYPNATGASPAIYFDDFIAEGTLEFVTGFNQGSSFFDPDGLPFLNTLNGLFNGLGYWVKVTEPFDPNGMVLTGNEPMAALTGASQQHANPNFMLVNGTSDLAQAAGTQVDVRRADGSLVAQLPVLEGGYLMTTALFGDDPSTDAIEGLQVGEELHFEVQGQRAEQSMVYSGQMDIKHLALTFGAYENAMDVYPNPFASTLQLNGQLATQGALTVQLTDAQGRMVAQHSQTQQEEGAWAIQWQMPELAPGMYTCTVLLDGERIGHQPLMHQ